MFDSELRSLISELLQTCSSENFGSGELSIATTMAVYISLIWNTVSILPDGQRMMQIVWCCKRHEDDMNSSLTSLPNDLGWEVLLGLMQQIEAPSLPWRMALCELCKID